MNVPKLIFWISVAVLSLMAALLLGLYSGHTKNGLFHLVNAIYGNVSLAINEYETISRQRPVHWTDARRYQGDGVLVNELPDNDHDFVLLQGWFDDGIEIRLIRRDGSVVNRWPIKGLDLSQHTSHVRNLPSTNWNFDTHGAVALRDGSIVFNLDYVGLFKLNKCGDLIWAVDSSTHHSVELNTDGSFWVSASRKHHDNDSLETALFKAPIAEDILVKISPDGEIVKKISLLKAFSDSDKMGLLTLTGGTDPVFQKGTRLDFNTEIFHLNDVEELPPHSDDEFSDFHAGDLLVSLRNRNLVLVLDAKTHLIKWWNVSDWVRQHDPDWNANGFISVFDNNRDGTVNGSILGSSKITQIDFKNPSDRKTIIYGSSQKQHFHSKRRGKHQILNNGHVLITEAEAGRVFQVNEKRKTVWDYVNGFDDTYSARINEARAYNKNYFQVSDWSCPAL